MAKRVTKKVVSIRIPTTIKIGDKSWGPGLIKNFPTHLLPAAKAAFGDEIEVK